VEPDEPFTAGHFRHLAEAKVKEIQERNRLPLLVGGCGLYIRALLDGLFSDPSEAPEVRERLRRITQDEGSKVLYERLRALDPVSAERIDPHDAYRIARALEIFEAAGKRPSEVRGVEWVRKQDAPFVLIGLWRSRASLYRLIEERIDSMMEAGLLQEVKSLLSRYSVDCRPFQSLGYSHLIAYLQGRAELEQMVSLWKRDTRRYAKRQMTWFSRDDRIHWVSLEEGEEEACRKIQELARTNLSGTII
jgi:tRNA dimethylallyltransferase